MTAWGATARSISNSRRAAARSAYCAGCAPTAALVFDPSPTAPVCDCGGRGHLGALASGRAWQRLAAGLQGRAPDLDAFAEPLARAVAMLHFPLGLEVFHFSGGLSDALGEPLRAAIVRRLPEQGWQSGQDWNGMLRLAPSDDAHALLGGALAACRAQRPSQATTLP